MGLKLRLRKKFKRIHLWLAIPAGVMITLICLTGSILVFQTELDELLNSDRHFHKVHQNHIPMQLDSLVTTVNDQLIGDTVISLKVYKAENRNIVATLSSGARVYGYVNPYSGQIIDINNARSGFFHNITTLHRWLMLPNRAVGKIIIGVSTICLIFILISGIVRWWPKKTIGNGFKFKWKNSNSYRKIFDLHKVLGIYATILLLVISFTGLMWSFDWYRQSAFKILGAETETLKLGKQRQKSEALNISTFWQATFDKSVEIEPNYQFATITKSGEIALLPSTANHPRATDKYRFDPVEGTIKLASKYGHRNNSSYIMSQNYAIHVGSWGGIVTKILWFLAALIGASLPITGYILYFKRKH